MASKEFIIVKSFDYKELEKLINEKAKKGYTVHDNLLINDGVFYLLMKKN